MNTRIQLILILVFSAWVCTSCQPNPIHTPASATSVSVPTLQPKPDPDIEEYAVYNDFLAAEFKGDKLDLILIIDHTRVNIKKLMEQNLAAFQEHTSLGTELVSSFKERNQQPYPLNPVLDFGVKYQLLTQEEIDQLRPLDEASGWKLLDERYPKSYGFVYLSRVGFNADFSEALIYTESFHYDQPIKGGYYLMVKQDGRWVVENSYEWMT